MPRRLITKHLRMGNEDIEGTKYEAFIATRWKTITLVNRKQPEMLLLNF